MAWPNIKIISQVNRCTRDSLSIDVINFNFQYKYYNEVVNYRGNHDLAKFLRHLCNAVKNPA